MSSDFIRRFGGQGIIRVVFNWPRFIDEHWPVTIHRLMPDQFDRVFTPWCDKDGRLGVRYDLVGARPVTVPEAASRRLEFDAERASRIQYMLDRAADDNADFDVPAFALPDDRFLLMDGNHRVTGLAASGIRRPITLHTVEGPIERTALCDLLHWERR